MIAISRHFEFASAHRLFVSVRQDHPCNCLHGHNYKGTVRLWGKLRENELPGMFIDFAVLKNIISDICNQYYDHFSIFHELDTLPYLLQGAGIKRICILPGDPTVELMCHLWKFQVISRVASYMIEHLGFDSLSRLAGVTVELYETMNSKAEDTFYLMERPPIDSMGAFTDFIAFCNNILDNIRVIT